MKRERQFISLLSDYGFKATFADESNTLFLKKALQALVQLDTPIRKVELLRNEFYATSVDSRGGICDLLCKDEAGRSYIVEMQLGYDKNFIHRFKFYTFHRFNTLVRKGEFKFDDLTPIYSIAILAKGIFAHSAEYYHFARLKNQKGEELDNQINYIFVEVNKFDKDENTIQTDLDKLIYLMKNLGHIKGLDQLPKFLTEDWVQQAIEKVDTNNMTPEEYMFFNMALAKNTFLNERDKREKEEVRAEGIKEGKAEGIKEGKEIGLEEGARNNSINIAKNLITLGLDNSSISQATGLSIEEIEELKK